MEAVQPLTIEGDDTRVNLVHAAPVDAPWRQRHVVQVGTVAGLGCNA